MLSNYCQQRVRATVCTLMAIAVVSLTSGCMKSKPADFTAAGFDVEVIDTIAVLPVVDHRIDQSKKLKLDRWAMPVVKRSLKQRGYDFTIHEDRSLVAAISREALEAPDAEFASALYADGARWVLLLVLEDSSSKLSFGSTGNAEMSGYLFDKQGGSLVWRHKELKRFGQGGLAGMFMKGVMEASAIEMATGEVFHALPIRKK